MKMTKIKFGIIGCGSIGKRHIAVVDADENAELVAVCDSDENVLKEIEDLYPSVLRYSSFSDLLNNTDINVVSICTPHGLHAEMAIKAAQFKKNILVEKPMALCVEDCKKMIDCARENNVKLWVMKQNRFNKPIAITKSAIQENKLGKILMIKCDVLWNRHQEYYEGSNWRGRADLEGGVLYTQVSHFIDLMIWWCGDVINAQTIIQTKNHKISIEDCGVSNIVFENGALGSITWTTCVYNKNYEGSITIIGEKGTIKIGGGYLNKIDFWDVQSYPLPENISFEDKPNNYGKYQGTSSNHDHVVKNIISQLLNERHDTVEGDEGMKTIAAIEKIYSNARYD
ncbi:MAG: Gfo/Idh/MocA family oxidoreductase [Hydrotalea sp.]|nr:Gfo/Idh/MocA family oxidoreductase [Hydrotalea sp.]